MFDPDPVDIVHAEVSNLLAFVVIAFAFGVAAMWIAILGGHA